MAFVQNVWQLAMLRFLVGISDACLLPAVQTLITRYSPSDAAGRIFSYNQSFQATGNVIGPMIGSSVSAAFGYRESLFPLLVWFSLTFYGFVEAPPN